MPLERHVLLEGDRPSATDGAGLLEGLDLVDPHELLDRPFGSADPARLLGADGEGGRR